ncbi:hypothetical protein Tco_0902035, partial [Tanacetum coccineum]
YDQIPKDDFGTATRGEEIDLTLFPLTPGPYQMSYPYEGSKYLLLNLFNVLISLLVPHRAGLNSCYTSLVTARNRLQEKFDRKAGEVKELKTELTDAKLALEKAKSRGYKDVVDGFWEEVARFVGSDVESLVQKLLSSDKFHAALVHIAPLGINYGVDRGLRMGRTDAEFEVIAQKVSNFHISAKADNRELRSQKNAASDKVKELQTELTDARVANIGLSEELSQTEAKLYDQALVVRDLHNQLALEKAKSQGYKDVVDGLREEVARFVGSDVESLVQKLLSSDEFHAALAHIASLSIKYGVERGLRMGPLVDFPTTLFPFLGKVVVASSGTLFEVTQILSDKHIRSVTSTPVAPSIANEDVDQVPFEHASDDLAASI